MSPDGGRRAVCLGFRTALQVAKALGPRSLSDAPRSFRLPDAPSRKADMERTIARLRELGACSHLTLPLHVVAASSSRCRASDKCCPHSCMQEVPAAGFASLGGGVFLAKAPLAFVQEATRLSFVSLLELGYELCGTYRIREGDGSAEYQVAPLMFCAQLRAFLDRNRGLNGAAKAARALRFMADGSASPRETKAAIVLALPSCSGGYGLSVPHMNFEVAASPSVAAMAGRKSFRCDLCWPQARVDVEYQSREHHAGEATRIRDSRRTNALMSMGFKVVGITNEELDSLEATDVIADTIGRALGRRRRSVAKGYHGRKVRLRKELGLGT